MIKPTMFDAFVNTMKKSHIARQSARKIVAQTQLEAPKLEAAANDILVKSGIDATVSCRVKGINSTAAKQTRYLEDFDTYQNHREEIMDIILGKGMSELIGDSYGIRYTTNTPNANKLFESILDCAKHKKNFFVSSMENYHGKGIKPYASDELVNEFANLTYKNSRGIEKQTISTDALKKTGYTRANINGKIHGVNAETQIGGKFTNLWGDVEHFLYDVRMGKKIDLSKLTPEQKIIALEIEKDYSKLFRNKKSHQVFLDDYLNKIWDTLRASEVEGLSVPKLPDFPKGYSETLRADNIMKLAHS